MKPIKSIFIVEDDPIMVFGFKKLINTSVVCQEIKTFGNGKQALEAIQEILDNGLDLPDIIFLDINMPIMDGWQFMEEFLKLDTPKKVNINVVTSSIDTTDRKNFNWFSQRTKHRMTYSYKPITKDQMLEILTLNGQEA